MHSCVSAVVDRSPGFSPTLSAFPRIILMFRFIQSLCRKLDQVCSIGFARMCDSNIGASPRPMVDQKLALSLLKELFPVSDSEDVVIVRELPSYDDRNFHMKLKLEESEQTTECVLKVLHSQFSCNRPFLDAHAKLLVHLGNHGFRCPVPMSSRQGTLFCYVDLPHDLHDKPQHHAVALWGFVPGVAMASLCQRPSHDLLCHIGSYIADMHACLSELEGSSTEAAIRERRLRWSTVEASNCRPGIPFIPDLELRNIVERVLERYEQELLPNLSSMSQGVVHGDLNESNIIVDPSRPDEVFGIIDTSDTIFGPYVVDLGIAMAYLSLLMIDGEQSLVDAVAPIVRSYCAKRSLNKAERESLHLWMMTRQVQTAAFGYQAFADDPDNEYILASARLVARGLPKLFAASPEDVLSSWFGDVEAPADDQL
eukprot:scpid80862/ scgid33903/ Aminoglycoside phosphotransferase domain-containing protein 1